MMHCYKQNYLSRVVGENKEKEKELCNIISGEINFSHGWPVEEKRSV